MKIEKQSIGVNYVPYIIAEMSGNHNQSLERALKIVEAAADSGAHALKLQTYTADTITLDIKKSDFVIEDEKNLWNGNSLHDLYSKAYTPWEWHKPIMKRAKELGMVCFSSPFDESAVDFLEELDVVAYKIASFENNHLPLIKKVASTGKPVIISIGMASIDEIHEAVSSARDAGCKDLILLKCTSTYPANPINSNILTIPHMRKIFNCEVGLSDHTMGIGASIAAVSRGATIIEKHFTLSRADGGVDSAFSLEPKELSMLVVESKRAWESLGTVSYGPTKDEEKSLQFRRSIYISENVKKGEVLTQDNLRIVRPGLGLHPRNYDLLIGKKVKSNLLKGTPASFDLIDQSLE
jgi:pseudaminic acid synthase